jgi:uncharacterized protein (DUF1499 family)
MAILLAAFKTILLFTLSTNAVVATPQGNELPQCVVTTHCVRENWKVDDVNESFKRSKELIASTPRTKIVESNDSFIHAEAKTKWMRYTDDLLIKALPSKGLIQVRSESRVGIGDNGVNRKRVNELAYRLMIPISKSHQ